MITLFLLEGFVLYAALGIWLVILGACVYSERYTVATLDVLALVGLLTVTGHLHLANTWHYILHNPFIILGGIVGFLIAGVVWARIKWGLLIARLRVKVDQWKKDSAAAEARAFAQHEADVARERAEFEAAVRSAPRVFEARAYVPRKVELPYDLRDKVTMNEDGRLSITIDRYKARIIGWIHYWPMSILLWIFGDFIRDVMDAIYRRIKGYFVRVADDGLNA